MKKIWVVLPIVFFLFSAILVFMSCEENEDDGKTEKHYLTISYHSEGHTEGEVPVDENRYEIIDRGQFAIDNFIPRYISYINIKDNGTLKGKNFRGWKLSSDNYVTHQADRLPATNIPYEKIYEFKDFNLNLYAIWN